MRISTFGCLALTVIVTGCNVVEEINPVGDNTGTAIFVDHAAGQTTGTTAASTSSTSTETGGAGGTTTTGSTTSTSASSSTTETGGGGAGGSTASGSGGGIVQPIITVDLGGVTSDVLIKKTQSADAVSLTVQATKFAKLKFITLTGQAQIVGSGCSFGQACARPAFATRVTSVSIWDSGTLVGFPMAPDPATGKVTINTASLALFASTTKTLTIKVSLGSAASYMVPYDQIAIGIEEPYDIINTDVDDNSILADVQSQVRIGQLGASPLVFQTIRPNGIVTITEEANPVSTIVVGGKGVWVPVAQYRAAAKYESAMMDRNRVRQLSPYLADNADVEAIAIASNGAPNGEDILPAGTSGERDIDISSKPITIPKDGSVLFQVWAKFASVQPSYAVGGAQTGVVRSGHAPAFGLADSKTDIEWTSEYAGKINARVTGLVSGERLYANAGAAMGNPMVLRKSVPTVTVQQLANATLSFGLDQELISYRISADSMGSIARRQDRFTFQASPNLSLQGLGIRRGAIEIDPAVVNVKRGFPNADNVLVWFTGDEITTNSGSEYSVHGSFSGVAPGSWFTICFERATNPKPVTGYLTSWPSGLMVGIARKDLDTTGPDYTLLPGYEVAATFWSDLSEGLWHDSVGYGSGDWSNDMLIQDPSHCQTLSF